MTTHDALCDLEAAVALIPDAATIALGGFSLNRNTPPVAFELVRQNKRELTVTQTIAGYETDLLVGAGCVSTLVFSGGSLDRLGRLPAIARSIETGAISAVSHSGMSLVTRYIAGSLGIPFMATRSLAGSDILEDLVRGSDDVTTMTCPFTDEEVVAVRALQPDFGILSVQRADRRGNFQIHGAHWDNLELAAASQSLIVVANELVETDLLRSSPETVVAAPHVAAVVALRWPAFPTAMHGVHDYHAAHLQTYLRAAGDDRDLTAYLDEFVWPNRDHQAFVDRVLGDHSSALYAAFPGSAS